jgi:hydroxymethylglutaryl-CoA lyase/(R)-citramalyl-CoA lyase
VTVTICDVGPRDGLQNEAVTLTPAVRAELCNRLARAGVLRIEAVSFVREDRVPQMVGAEDVVAALDRQPDVVYAGLVLNEQGYDRLRSSGLDEAHVTFAATESFSRRNANVSVDEAVVAAASIVARAADDGIRTTATISVAFGCPFEGAVDSGRVLALAGEIVAAGAAEVVFADTIGVAVPTQIKDVLGRAVALDVPLGVHLHNTRNTAIVCAYAALEAGATVFDASVGGAGGCPFAPNATGNVSTEDLVYLLHGEGIETGIDLDALIDVARWLEEQLGHPLDGLVHRAGPFLPVS